MPTDTTPALPVVAMLYQSDGEPIYGVIAADSHPHIAELIDAFPVVRLDAASSALTAALARAEAAERRATLFQAKYERQCKISDKEAEVRIRRLGELFELKKKNAALSRAAKLEGDLGILQAELEMVERERDALRAALVELVALKDLKLLIHMAGTYPLGTAFQDMSHDYYNRKPLAWDAARAAVAGVPKPIQTQAQGHQAGLSIPGVRTEPGGSS